MDVLGLNAGLEMLPLDFNNRRLHWTRSPGRVTSHHRAYVSSLCCDGATIRDRASAQHLAAALRLREANTNGWRFGCTDRWREDSQSAIT